MPELPEVETTCQGIKPHLVNQTIANIIIRTKKLRWPITPDLKKQLNTCCIIDVVRRAKYIVIKTSNGNLIIHLGMSGTLRVVTVQTALKKHDHFDCVLANGKVLRYNDPRRFGAILWANTVAELSIFATLGPEPFASTFNAHYLQQQSQNRKIPIKALIMNNQVVVGVGNIYASESLFAAQISPQMPSNHLSLEQASKLVKSLRKILAQAIAQGGTTLKDFYHSDGKPGYFKNKLKVYDRKGKPCFRCKSEIQSIKIAQRMTYYCANCQVEK